MLYDCALRFKHGREFTGATTFPSLLTFCYFAMPAEEGTGCDCPKKLALFHSLRNLLWKDTGVRDCLCHAVEIIMRYRCLRAFDSFLKAFDVPSSAWRIGSNFLV